MSTDRITLRDEFPLPDPDDMLVALVAHENVPCRYEDGVCQEHFLMLGPNACAVGSAREYLKLNGRVL